MGRPNQKGYRNESGSGKEYKKAGSGRNQMAAESFVIVYPCIWKQLKNDDHDDDNVP